MQINQEYWSIAFVSPNHPALRRSTGGYTIGACDDNLKTIFISEGLSNWQMRKVLCHEITHAAMFSYNVDLELAQEEMVADLIATYGQQIIDETNRIFDDVT